MDLIPIKWLTVPDVADRLGVEAGAVRRMLADRRVVAARQDGVQKIPEQFLVEVDGGWQVLASLQGTLTVLSDVGFDDESAITWLVTPDADLGAAPLEALRAGH